MKPTRGGKREGSGRKPRKVARVAVTVRLEPADSLAFRKVCFSYGLSQSGMIAQWVKQEALNED